MTCRLTKTSIKTALGTFYGFKREQTPPLHIDRLVNSGAITVLPFNCWLSRTLRLFRARQTNRRGLDAGPMPVISTHPDLPTARRRLKWIKQGATHEHP